MQARWLKNIPIEEHEDFRKRLNSVQDVLEVLDQLLLESECSVEIARLADYTSASWAYEQADRNGYIRAMREVRKLLDLETT